MKKNIVVFLVAVFVIFSGTAWSLESKGSTEIGSATPSSATLQRDLADAMRNATKGVVGSASAAKKAAEKAEKNSAGILGVVNGIAPDVKIINEATDRVEKKVGSLENSLAKVGENLSLTNANVVETAKITVENGKAINWLGSVLGVLIVLGLVVVVVLLRNGQNGLASDISRLSGNIAGIAVDVSRIPDETAKLVKQLKPVTLTFEVLGKEVTYTPAIVDGVTYRSLYVPKDAEVSANPADTVRFSHVSVDKIRNSGKKVVKDYLSGGFNGTDDHSKMQNEVVRFALATKELVIA